MMKRLLMCFAITAFVSGCGQTTPAVTTAPKLTKPATNQTRVRAQTLTPTASVMQIVAHDGDKEANTMADKSLTNDDWNYSSTSAQSAFGKGVDWLETDVILNKPTGFLYMQHSADCRKADGTTVDLMEAQPVQIGECAELFENQLDDIQRPGQWMIEIKGNLAKGSEMTSEYRVAVMDALYNVLDQRGRLSSEIITSMDKDVLRLFKERADRQQVSVHLGRVYPLSLVVNGDNRPTKSSLDADKAQGFEYSSAAVKDWTNENIDYAKKIGLQTMGWGWDDWWTGGRYPTLDNDDGIELCVDFMLTEAINDLKSKDRTCKRDPNPGFNPYIPIGDPNGNSGGNPVQEIQYDLYMENRCVFDSSDGSPSRITYNYSYIYSTDGAAPTVSQPRQLNGGGLDGNWTGYDLSLQWNTGTKWGSNGFDNGGAALESRTIYDASGELRSSYACTYQIGKRDQFNHIISGYNVIPKGPIDWQIINGR